jgi:hypothetical protein
MMTSLAEQVRLLNEGMEALKLSSMASSSSTSTHSILAPRQNEELLQEAIRVATTTRGTSPRDVAGEVNPPSKGVRLPPQPTFNGSNFGMFIKRFTRWLEISGMEGAEDRVLRNWLLASMETTVVELVEGLYERTKSYEELLRAMAAAYPSYSSDLTLRQDFRRLPQLGVKSTAEDFELLVVRAETIWSRFTTGALGDQEAYLMLADKCGPLWHIVREHPAYRHYEATVSGLKEAIRAFLLHRFSESAISLAAQSSTHSHPSPAQSLNITHPASAFSQRSASADVFAIQGGKDKGKGKGKGFGRRS